MPGYPATINRDAFGPQLENEFPTVNPKNELDANGMNLNFWQLAGVNRTAPFVEIFATVTGAAVTTVKQSLAFDPDAVVPDITFSYDGVGLYSFAFDTQYPDLNGTPTNLVLHGGAVHPQTSGGALIGNVLMTSGIAGGLEIRDAADALTDSDFIIVLYGG